MVSLDTAAITLECSHNAPTTHHTGRKNLWVQSVGSALERILVPQHSFSLPEIEKDQSGCGLATRPQLDWPTTELWLILTTAG
jgi:hypothetical protein